MNHHSDRLHYLYQRYINKSCTHQEMQELFAYVSDPGWKDRLETITDEHLEQLQIPESLPQIDWEFMYNKIIPAGREMELNHQASPGVIRWITWKRMAAAAI